MSFFKRLLPAFDDPPDRDQANTHVVTTGERGPRITLGQIRRALYDADDEHNPYEPGTRDQTANVVQPPEFDISSSASTVEEVLQATRDFLYAEIVAEQDRVDSTPELLFERVILHPKGNTLPEFSSAEELRNVRNVSDLTIPLKSLGTTYDKDMMDRIRAGQGPRAVEVEDLVGKLRFEPRPCFGPDNAPCSETYHELLVVLQAWNMRVGTIPNSTQIRDLLDALESRCQLIDEVEKGHKNKKLLEQPCLRLRQTLHAYRPELRNFEDQNMIHQLIILIANHGLAFPDLDNEIKYRAVETLFREYRSDIYLGEEHSAKRDRIKAEIERARLQEDETGVQELVDQKKQLDKESCNQASEKVRTAIRIARKRVCMKVLEELQHLTEQQASQKWAARTIAKAPASVLARSCIENESTIDSMLQDWELNIEQPLEAAIERLHKTKRLSNDNNSLLRKIACLDVPTSERKAVMERRRNDPRTPYIMMDVANQSSQIQGMSQRVAKHIGELDDSLDSILETARDSHRAHDTLLTRVDEDDPHCIEETSYVVKEPQAMASGGKEAVKAQGTMLDEERGPEKPSSL